jgi:hypothetical protein
VFDYMASTEGTSTYSQFTTDRTGAVVDQVSLNPNSANRVRGISNANVAFGNIATTGRVPVDPLWMDALELSRGPNANIFGLGNASGTVNQVPATANLTRNFTRVEMRADSYEGWRASLDVNRVLIKNKLSVRASYAYQHTGFIRKPAEENARRLSFQVKAQPFKNTTLSASYYGYKNTAVRPNFTTPRDYYTDWLRAGQPGWNPVTRLVTFANGQTMGSGNTVGSTTPYPVGTTPNVFVGADNRSIFQIGAPGQDPYWTITRYTNPAATNGTGPFATTDPFASSYIGAGLLQSGAAQVYTATQQPLFNSVTRPIGDKSIYDWTKINLAGNSKAWDDVDTYLAQIDQIILNTPKHTLAFQGTYMREDAQRLENQPMGPASVNSNVGQLQVDVNQVNLDGSDNPYFGRPFLKSSEPYLRDKPWLWNTGRAQGAYRVDFSQDEGWTKWLGTQQVLGYYEYKDQQNRQYTYRHSALGTNTGWQQKYIGLNTPLGNRVQQTITDPRYGIAPGNYARVAELYYVGNTRGGGIEYAPNYFPEGASLPYVWGPAGNMIYDVSGIGFTPSPDGGGGAASVQTVIKTTGGVIQSTFFNGKLVGTYGLREDKVYDRNGVLPTLTPDLRAYDRGASDKWASTWREAAGKTKTLSVVARPFQDLRFLKSHVSGGSGIGKFLAEAANSFSPTYNKSDNFIPQGPAYDLFLNRLPNQTGISKDIGFWMTMLDGRLSVRYTRFDTKQLNLRDGDITTMAQRIMRYEGFVSNDAWNLRSQVSNWLVGAGTGQATASDEQIAAAIQMPIEQYKGLKAITANGTYAAAMDSQSKGDELEINFNPSRHWTVSASVTKTEAVNTAAGSAVDDYIAARMPIWTTLEDPRFTQTTQTIGGVTTPYPGGAKTLPTGATGHLLWWNILGADFNTAAGYNNTNSAATNFAGNVDAPMAVFRELVGRPRPQIRKYAAKFNTKYNLAGITDHKILKNVSVGGSARWTDKAAIGFYGLGYDPAKDLTLPANRIVKYDTNRPIYSPAETYVDLFVSYNTKLFGDKVRARFQLNVKNVGEDGGGLQVTDAFLDGTPKTYRIVDPRQFILSASFDL